MQGRRHFSLGDLSSLDKLDVFEFLVNLRSHKRTKRPVGLYTAHKNVAVASLAWAQVHLNIHLGLGVGTQEVRQVGVERDEVWERRGRGSREDMPWLQA